MIKFLDKDMVGKLVQYDSAPSLLFRDSDKKYTGICNSLVETERIVGDMEHLPFAENSFDGVVSSLALHWVNDLPGTLIQVQRSLKPDGVFLGAMFGGETLYELRYFQINQNLLTTSGNRKRWWCITACITNGYAPRHGKLTITSWLDTYNRYYQYLTSRC